MIIEYVGVKEINGSLVVIDGVKGVSYEEIVDIRLDNGTVRQGRVVQMFSTITYPNGTLFECDTRSLLEQAVARAKASGFEFTFGAEQEFYLFLQDEEGKKKREWEIYMGERRCLFGRMGRRRDVR